jgi:hypothetical protein
MSDRSRNLKEPLEPSGIAQFVEHDRCLRYLKQRVDPGDEPEARDWREAFGLMNIALLGHGREFEATQIEALAANATTVIGPHLDATTAAGVPDITVDEAWVDSPKGRRAQLHAAVEHASSLSATDDEVPYVLLYQAPLDGHLGSHDIYGDADCIVLAPADAVTQSSPSVTQELRAPDADTQPPRTDPATADVVARVIDCKSAREEQPGHRVQVATYCGLLERTLAEGPAEVTCHIEASVLTQATAASPDDTLTPFSLPTFRRKEWELFVTRLLSDTGPVSEALTDDLADLPFSLDQVCDNCAYKEACMTRAVEDPTAPASLAVLGLDASVQRALRAGGITSLRDLSEVLPRPDSPTPTDDPPRLDIPAETQRTLEEALPGPVHETVLRAQALRGELDPEYSSYRRPPAMPGTDWVPLPDDRCAGWGNCETADPGELIHVAIFVRADATIDRCAALGACVYAKAHGEYHTIGEVIDAVPDDPDTATAVERDLLESFLDQLFDAIERVATALGTPENAVVHCYTYSRHEREALAETLERHSENSPHARACRALWSLHPEGHTGVDQAMVSAVQPIINDHFALTYPSQGILAVVDQFLPTWTIEAFDPLDARPEDPPLRAIFREQFLNDRVPYLADEPGIRLHLARGLLAEGPAADAADTDAAHPSPDGWYPVRKRSGGQFPIEYVWAATPREPDETKPRLRPGVVEEWAVEEDTKPLYRQEINRFYYRTDEHDEPLQQADVEYLAERLAYALLRLVEAIPYKDAYLSKEPLDATRLPEFTVPVTDLPAAARDYLRMEHGASRAATLAHYRQPLRDRVRSGRSIPLRCTDYEECDNGSLAITGELAYDRFFEDPATAARMQRQARIRSPTGPGSGSWRLLTRLAPSEGTAPPNQTGTAHSAADSPPEPTAATETGAGPSARGHLEATVESPEATKHSPPVLVEDLDHETGTIRLQAFPHRFRQHGSPFRVAHRGWDSPAGSNLADPTAPPSERPGYVADQPPVWIDTDEVYVLDPMLDDFAAPKADRALRPKTVDANALWQHIQRSDGRATTSPPSSVHPMASMPFWSAWPRPRGVSRPTRTSERSSARSTGRSCPSRVRPAPARPAARSRPHSWDGSSQRPGPSCRCSAWSSRPPTKPSTPSSRPSPNCSPTGETATTPARRPALPPALPPTPTVAPS